MGLYVGNIEGKFFLPGESVPSAHLCQSGKSGPHGVSAGLPGAIEGQVFFQEWSGAHEAHVPTEHVV